MSKYHFRVRPRLLLNFGHIPLPCKENIWEAGLNGNWETVGQNETGS